MVIIGKCTRCQQVVDLDSNRKVQGCPSCDKMIVVERAVENFEQYHTDAERRKADRILEIHNVSSKNKYSPKYRQNRKNMI